MDSRRIAAVVYGATTAVVVAFQLALAAGAPWGSYAMGGGFPGQFPPLLRLGAVVQASVLGALAGVVLARASVALPGWAGASRRLVWLVVAVAAISLVLNLTTPSAGERMIWAPVAVVLLACSLRVAIGPTR
jgi:hypothetical protein